MVRIRTVIVIIGVALFMSGCTRDLPKKPTYRQQQCKQISDKKTIIQPDVAKKNPKLLTFAELRIAKEYTIAIDNKAKATMYLEHMVKQCSDPTILKEIYLELADLYFEQGKMDLAHALYSSFITLFPGSACRAYVHYQAILCKFYTTFSSDRDQTRTEDTFKLTQLYMQAAQKDTVYKEYCDDVSSIQKQCCKKMYDHEIDIFNYYYKKGNYRAAQVHLDEIKKNYLDMLQEVEPDLLALECNVATKQGDTKTFAIKHAELQSKYPHIATIKLAANNPKTDHVIRF